jgi:hypothetical protein
MKESISITSRSRSGPAPADQARRIDSASTRSSWRRCPKLNERRKLPSVEGASTRCPSSASVPPARSTPQSSIESAPQRHCLDERADPAARPRGARALAEIDRLLDKPLQPQPVDQGARQDHAGVGDQALIVELDGHRVGPHGHPRIHHHASDPPTQATAALYSRSLPAQQVIFVNTSDGSDPTTRWIEAKTRGPSLSRRRCVAVAEPPDVRIHGRS